MKKNKHKRRVRMRVHLAPSRRSKKPFCAYYGPHGETCPMTEDLQPVWSVPAAPGGRPIGYMACPKHYEEVHRSVQDFLASLPSSLDP